MSTAIVFSGGGSKIHFQDGANQALEERGLVADAYYGVSCGALLSFALGHIGSKRTREILTGIKGREDILWDNFLPTVPWQTGFAHLGPLKKMLEKVATMPPRPDAKPSTVGFVDYWDRGRLLFRSSRDTPIHEMPKWCLASSSIPIIMDLADGRYADGGVREQTPLKRAIDDGHDRIVVVLANPLTEDIEGANWRPSFPKPLSVAWRTSDIMSHDIFVNDIPRCLRKNSQPGYKKIDLVIVEPPHDLGETLDFSPELAAKRRAIGYAAGKAVSL